MVNIEMTGAQIKKVLEDALNFKIDPSGSWGAYPRASGLRFDVNEGELFGARIINLEVNPRLEGEWEGIDMEETYTVVTNSFIAHPRDGYYEFGNVPAENKVDSYVEYAQSFIEYVKSVGTITAVADENKPTQHWSDQRIVKFCNNYGCLSSSTTTNDVGVLKADDSRVVGVEAQEWIIHTDTGTIESGLVADKCLGRLNKAKAELVDCGSAPRWVYDAVRGTLYMATRPGGALTGSATDPRAKFMSIRGDGYQQFELGMIWNLIKVY